MKPGAAAAWACATALSLAQASGPVSYGPDGCVSISVSPSGSCVFSTNCQDVDLGGFEFAFDCTTPQDEVQRHTFGVGGFDAVELFDTEVKCKQCAPPLGVVAQEPPATARSLVLRRAVVAGMSKARKHLGTAADAIKYGPKKCVSVYKDKKSNHCIMQTECKGVNTSDYDYGLICVNKSVPERHSFGKNSFNAVEKFDTLIACNQCQGLEDIEENVALNGRVVAVVAELKGLNGLMKNISTSVAKLGKKVFPSGFPANAPTTTKAPTNTTTKAPAAGKFLLHHGVRRHRAHGVHHSSKIAHRHVRAVAHHAAHRGHRKTGSAHHVHHRKKARGHAEQSGASHHSRHHRGHKRSTTAAPQEEEEAEPAASESVEGSESGSEADADAAAESA